MGSLFSKIFLSFWLAAVLLGAALIAVARLSGGEAIAEAERALATQAQTAAVLWSDGGERAVARWLHRVAQDQPLLLLDAGGEPVLPRQRLARRVLEGMPKPLQGGVHRLGRGHVAVVAPLAGVEPPLFLATELRPGQLPLTPIWLRIALALAVTGLVSFGLASLLTRRLRRLRRAAQALAAGDLSVRVGHRGRDEVAALARDFDQMAEQVRELLETQKRLMRDVSHELRSPLARLRVALELAERDGDAHKALARIGKEADALEHLIADVLSLARMESGQFVLERRPVALRELLEKVITDADFEAQARERRVTLSAEAAPSLSGDPVLLRSALENVIRNAIRYTASGSAVEVVLRQQAATAMITIRDHGPGVAEQDLQAIFTPFARSEAAREHSGGGYGLGLGIASRAVAAHGGEIHATNHPEGGLLVTVTLPVN